MATPAQIKAGAAALIVQAANRDGVTLDGDILAQVPQEMADEALADAEAVLKAAAAVVSLILPGGLHG